MKCRMMMMLVAVIAFPIADRSATAALLPATRATCASTFVDAVTFDDAADRAARDLRRCIAAADLQPSVARRALSAIADLRDRYAYDRRRASATRSLRRDRIYMRRLRVVMARAIASPADER